MTEAVVMPIVSPDRDMMRQHLEHLFGGDLDGCHDGLIEIAWTRSTPDKGGRYPLCHAQLFPVDQIDRAVDEAFRQNLVPNQNVYVGAALRKPDTPPFGRGDDSDFYAGTCVWADLDDGDAARHARTRYAAAPPTRIIVTGRYPDLRAQCWWRLETPERDPDRFRAMNEAVCAHLYGDPSVVNPGRVMRLGGSIAWPLKEGRQIELTEVKKPADRTPTFYVDTILQEAFPPLPQASAPRAAVERQAVHATNTLGLATDRIVDGREAYMRDTVMACFREYIGENGAEPTPDELFEIVWPQYSAKADLESRPGRGADEVMDKCVQIVRRFARGQLPGLPDLNAVVASHQARKAQEAARPGKAAAASPTNDNTAEPAFPRLLDWTADRYLGEPPEIRWLCKGTIQLGVPMLLAAMGGLGKSFLALDTALTIALGVTGRIKPKKIFGGEIVEFGTAVILSAEDSHASIHRRLAKIDPQARRKETGGRLIIVPMPNVGGPRPLIASNKDGIYKTDAFYELKRQLLEIEDLKLVILDPLQAFISADVSSDPAAGQFMWTAFAEICAETGATVCIPHHMRKEGSAKIKTIDDAREAIRGVTTLVDSARVAYAMWKEHADEAQALCAAMDIPYDHGKVVKGAVVKSNDEEDKSIHTYIRQPTGLLEDRSDTAPKPSEDGGLMLTNEQIAAVQTEIDRRWRAHKPFSMAANSKTPLWAGIVNMTGMKAAEAKALVRDWTVNEVIAEEMFDTKNKLKGVRVTKWLRQRLAEVPEVHS